MKDISSPGKLWWAVTWLLQRLTRFDRVSRARIRRASVRNVGVGYGAWVVPTSVLRQGAVAYTAGVGTDTTLDEALVTIHGMDVHALDPTPRAVEHAAAACARVPRLCFHPVGLWKEDAVLTFFQPANPAHVSHSLTGLHGSTPGFSAPCKRLATLMTELGHDRIDFLKIDIEGAEYAVLEDMVASGVHPEALCVEFDETHSPRDANWRRRIHSAVRRLATAGYRLVHVAPKGNYTFVRSKPPARAQGEA